jgi:hypothetical protein
MEVKVFEFVNPRARRPAVEAVCRFVEGTDPHAEGKVSAGLYGETWIIGIGTEAENHSPLLNWAARQEGCLSQPSEFGGTFFSPESKEGKVTGKVGLNGTSTTLMRGVPKAAVPLVIQALEERIAKYIQARES